MDELPGPVGSKRRREEPESQEAIRKPQSDPLTERESEHDRRASANSAAIFFNIPLLNPSF